MNQDVPTMQQLLEAGVHFGHKVSRGNPGMKPYIFGAREGVQIIDLAHSEEKLKEATQAAYELGKSGKVLLLVGTKKQARPIVEELAQKTDIPYLTARWVGGLLTNFEEMYKNVHKLMDLREKQQKGELSHYTKKERLLISRKIEKFEEELGGVAHLTKVPDAIFVIDAVSDNTAVKEANKLNIPLLGLCDSNANPNWFAYPVPANDDGIKSIQLVSETVLGAYAKGRSQAATDKANEEAKQKEQEEKAASEVDDVMSAEAAAIEDAVEKEIVAESGRKGD